MRRLKIVKKGSTWFCKPYIVDCESSWNSDADHVYQHFVDDGVVIKDLTIEVEAETGRAGMKGNEEDKWFTHVN